MTFLLPLRQHGSRLGQACSSYSRRISTTNNKFVQIVEVGPRDGLQNEPNTVSIVDRVSLINRLGASGLTVIEAGSFVSPKWVPQMANTAEVLKSIDRHPRSRYPVLVPNLKGFDSLQELNATASSPLTDEISVFTAASESFSKANTNVSIADSLARLEAVTTAAISAGYKVRGYVSTVITCPYEGAIAPKRVRDVAKALIDMGCYEVSLGDTVGTGTPLSMYHMLSSVLGAVNADRLAAHCHDTYGTGVANVMTAIEAGIRTVDSSVAGLGGCPYSPGATGNVATEDIVHVLHGSGYHTGVDLEALVEVGKWISGKLERRNESRAGAALLAQKARHAQK